MDFQGTDRWADMVSEISSTESVYVNFDVVSASDEVLQADLEPEDTSSDVNDINTVVVESETVVPQCLLEVKPHRKHEAVWFTERYRAFAKSTLLQSYVVVDSHLWIINTCIVRRLPHVPLGLHCCSALDPISRSFCLRIEHIAGNSFFDQWNKDITPGSYIIKINGISDSKRNMF